MGQVGRHVGWKVDSVAEPATSEMTLAGLLVGQPVQSDPYWIILKLATNNHN